MNSVVYIKERRPIKSALPSTTCLLSHLMSIIIHSSAGDNIQKQLIERTHSILYDAKYNDHLYQRVYHFEPSFEDIVNNIGKHHNLDYYDTVSRIMRLPNIQPLLLLTPRYYVDGKLTRILPDFIIGQKQYPAFVVQDVLDEDLRKTGVLDSSSEQSSYHLNDTAVRPCDKTRKNWRDWYRLNVNIFLSILIVLFHSAPDHSGYDLDIGQLLAFFIRKKRADWLKELAYLAHEQKRALVCAPW